MHLIPFNLDVIYIRPCHALHSQPRNVVEGPLLHPGRHLPLVLKQRPVAELHLQGTRADDSEDAPRVLVGRVLRLVLVLGDVLREEARREVEVAEDVGQGGLDLAWLPQRKEDKQIMQRK